MLGRSSGPAEADRLVDLRQTVGVRRGIVGPVGGLRDLGQQRLVQRGRDLVAVEVDHGATRAAQPDRIDLDPGHRGQIGHVQRVRPFGVLTVGQHDHRGASVVADVGPTALVRAGWVGAGVLGDDRLTGDGRQRGQDPGSDGGPTAGSETIDRAEDRRLVGRRLLHDHPDSTEGDHPDLDRLGLGVDERPGGSLGGVHPGRGHVGGHHAGRGVEGEDDRSLPVRIGDGGLGSRQPDQQDGQPQQQQHSRNVPQPVNARGRAGQAQPGERVTTTGPSTQQPAVGEEQHRHQDEAEQQRGPDEGHDHRRCRRRRSEIRARARTRSSSVPIRCSSVPAVRVVATSSA